MRVTFLGTGAAGGVPLYGCECAACARGRQDPRYVRRPCCALVEHDGTRVLLDAGLTDLHERFAPGFLTAIVLTHFHPDHVQGLFHLRWGKANPIAVYGPPDTDGCADLFKHPGMLSFRTARKFEAFKVEVAAPHAAAPRTLQAHPRLCHRGDSGRTLCLSHRHTGPATANDRVLAYMG